MYKYFEELKRPNEFKIYMMRSDRSSTSMSLNSKVDINFINKYKNLFERLKVIDKIIDSSISLENIDNIKGCVTDIIEKRAEGDDIEIDIPNGKIINKNYLGKNIANYDSMLVLSHFKGHPMGGYGGAIKQLSIGCASAYGKAYIHGAGKAEEIWTADHNKFLESMADAASSVIDYFKGNIVYINIMCNMSVDCDC